MRCRSPKKTHRRLYSDLHVGPPFWERLDHAVRITLATVYNVAMIFRIVGTEILPVGVVGVALLLAFQNGTQTTGDCLGQTARRWRVTGVAFFLGLLVSLVFRPVVSSGETGRIVYRVLFPLVNGVVAWGLSLSTWIPMESRGVAMVVFLFMCQQGPEDLYFPLGLALTVCFGLGTILLFKLIPLPMMFPSPPEPLSWGGKPLAVTEGTRLGPVILLRVPLAVPKAERWIARGKEWTAGAIELLVDHTTATTTTARGPPRGDRRDSGVFDEEARIASHETLAAARVLVEKLEHDVLLGLEALQAAAEAELWLFPTRCIRHRKKAFVHDWVAFFRAILPNLRLLLSISVAKQHERDGENVEGIRHALDDWFPREGFPFSSLARALQTALLRGDEASVSEIHKAHSLLKTALQEYRFRLFYKVREGGSSALLEWNHFLCNVSFVHGLSRLASEVVLVTNAVESSDREHHKAKYCPTSTMCWKSLMAWIRGFVTLFAGDIECKKPFAWDHENLRDALSFSVQICFATLWYAIPQLNQRLNDQGIYVAVTTCFISVGKFGRSFQKSVQRLLGTSLAIVWAIFIIVTLRLEYEQAVGWTYLYCFLCILVTDRKQPYVMTCAAFTIFLLICRDVPFDTQQEFLLNVTYRMSNIGISVVQFIIIEMVFFRSSARTALENQCESYFGLMDSVFDRVIEFSESLRKAVRGEEEEEEEEEGKSQILDGICSCIAECKDSTEQAKADYSAALEEPGPRVDVKTPFLSREYELLLALQSETNAILSQILDSLRTMVAMPEKKPRQKIAYHEGLKIFHAMIEHISLPLKQVAATRCENSDNTNPESELRIWINSLRRFKTFVTNKIIQDGFDQLRSQSLESIDVERGYETKEFMVEQELVVQLCVVSWSIWRICHRLEKAVSCFERIASERPCYFSMLAAWEATRVAEEV